MAQCAVGGCEKPGNMARGWCNRHYLRWYRHGDPEYQVVLYKTCVVENCGKSTNSRKGLCEMHRARARRHGDVQVVLPRRRPSVGYQAAHNRVHRDLGPARDRTCVDCGRPAHDWSYNHGDPAELLCAAQGFPYSLDPGFYEPRCRSCHVLFDRGPADALGSEPTAR